MYLDNKYKNTEEYLQYERYNKNKRVDSEIYDIMRLDR